MVSATMPMGMADGVVLPLAPPAHRLSQFGDYDILAPLARGGMGGVYLAVHAWTGERVALKVLDLQYAGHPEIVERLQAEHALASRIRHPGIVDIRGSFWTDDQVPYLVMEYLAGEPLGAIADRGPLELPSIISICAQAAAALAALHEVGVIHCDVKHDNLFVLDEHVGGWPRVKVIDFGVSRWSTSRSATTPRSPARRGASRPSSGAASRARAAMSTRSAACFTTSPPAIRRSTARFPS